MLSLRTDIYREKFRLLINLLNTKERRKSGDARRKIWDTQRGRGPKWDYILCQIDVKDVKKESLQSNLQTWSTEICLDERQIYDLTGLKFCQNSQLYK